jgi:hypothetical protein
VIPTDHERERPAACVDRTAERSSLPHSDLQLPLARALLQPPGSNRRGQHCAIE